MSKDSKALQPNGKLLTFHPTGEYYFSKGLKAYQRKDLDKAKRYLERAVQLEPGEPMMLCQLAIVCSDMGEHKESNQYLHNILEEIDENMVECHYFLANNYAHLGFFKDSYHHANLYLELEQDGEFVEETEDLLEILTLESEEFDEDLYEHDDMIMKQEEARELLESGQFKEAVSLLKSVVKDFPGFWSAYNNLALAYFYLGEVNKADDVLNDVLSKNHGNLHALCNKLVFAHYQQEEKKVIELKSTLKKIKPMLLEHQYKLGATFALTGEYEEAYSWLRRLQKKGFEGDGAFYYWLTHSAYYTGREAAAKSSWKKVLDISPDKKGQEPWNEKDLQIDGVENHLPTVFDKLDSNFIEERLFGLFLTSRSDKKEDILVSDYILKNKKFTELEKRYISIIKDAGKKSTQSINIAHETAEFIYDHHQPFDTIDTGLYLMWFSLYMEMEKSTIALKNCTAWAAAVEYTWIKLNNEKTSQQTIAKQYSISTSTLQKYIKLINKYLN